MSSTLEDRLRGAIGDRYVLGALIGEGGMAGSWRMSQRRRVLFRRMYEGQMPHANFVELPDGHLVMISAPAGVEPDMMVVVNWFAELGKRTR